MIKRWLPAVLWCAFIFVMSSLKGADFSSNKTDDFIFRKSLHLLEYAVLCLAFYRATKKPLIAVLLTILYAASDEFHQTLIPTRTGKISDVLIDSISVVITGGVLWKYYHLLPKKLKIWLEE